MSESAKGTEIGTTGVDIGTPRRFVFPLDSENLSYHNTVTPQISVCWYPQLEFGRFAILCL